MTMSADALGEFAIVPSPAVELRGDESFVGLDATVLDFWRFAVQDLRMNTLRGYLAEFVVARALGAQANRTEWDPYDVLWHDPRSGRDVRIEVKSSAYLQAWPQHRLSTPSFSCRPSAVLDVQRNT